MAQNHLKMMKKESPERVPAEEHYTVDEYLSFERASVDVKHEYLDGLIVAMAGASRAHNLITGNIVVSDSEISLRERPAKRIRAICG